MENNNSSGTNTVLIVIVIIILVALGAWWFVSNKSAPARNDAGIDVKLDLPDGNNEAPSNETSNTPSGGSTSSQ